MSIPDMSRGSIENVQGGQPSMGVEGTQAPKAPPEGTPKFDAGEPKSANTMGALNNKVPDSFMKEFEKAISAKICADMRKSTKRLKDIKKKSEGV